MANRPVYALAQQRIKAGADGQRQVVAKAEIRQRQPDHAVNRPSMQPPVKEGRLHGFARASNSLRSGSRRRQIVHQRLAHAEIHQPDAHAGGEQHRQPSPQAEFRFGIVRAKLDLAVIAERNTDQRQHKNRHCQHIKPAEVHGNPALDGFKKTLGLRRPEGAK